MIRGGGSSESNRKRAKKVPFFNRGEGDIFTDWCVGYGHAQKDKLPGEQPSLWGEFTPPVSEGASLYTTRGRY